MSHICFASLLIEHDLSSEQIYVEIERARLTKTLANIKEQSGDVKEAASILQELQVRKKHWKSEHGFSFGPLKTEACASSETSVNVLLQVETYGSMEKKEKVEFILEQMRLCIAVKDYIRTQIISKKINTKFFQEDGTEVRDAN